MKHIGIKTAQIRLIAILLLIMGTISSHAQYYINIGQTVGTRLRYAVSAIDSVWFDKYEQQEPSGNYEYDLNIRQTDGTRLRYAVSAVDRVWFDKDEQQESSGNYEYVDLGLSVNWATFNVGATAPEDFGDYFAWGETETKTYYGWSTYKYCNGSYKTITKYCSNSSCGNNGFTDPKTTLDPEDDVAHVAWGGSWRMPTQADFNELLNKCDWVWVTQNGVNGWKVTSRKDSSRSIFLPAADYRGFDHLTNVGFSGVYWSSSLNPLTPYLAYYLLLRQDAHFTNNVGDRDYGFSVRPVCPSSTYVSSVVDSIMLSNNELSLVEGVCVTIFATPLDVRGDKMTANVSWRSSDTTVARVVNGKITTISAGTCIITAYVDKAQSTCIITVKSAGVYEYVDLGLSVNWATFNVGATVPEEYGDYFAWGETEPYYEPGYAQEDPQAHWKNGKWAGYDWSNYKYCNGWPETMIKYCNESSSGNNGFTDSLTTLLPEDDVAHVKWGGYWRMPTQAEYEELQHNCDWTRTTQNGVEGYKVTSRKDSSRSIFLPAAGYRHGTSIGFAWSDGVYWASSLADYPDIAWNLTFYSDIHYTSIGDRLCGCTVRPVCPSSTYVPPVVDSIALSESKLNITEGKAITISATPLDENGNKMTADVSWRSGDTTVARVVNGKITAISAGTCIITAYVDKVQSTCIITVKSAGVYEYVDLGLSVNWATFNVGATVPEEYGDYFAWGETEPYYEAGYAQENPQTHWKDGKSAGYDWSNYKYCNGWYNKMTKYCCNSNYGRYGNDGFTDTLTTLLPEDDVAHVKWGGSWRMPTQAEFLELRNDCDWRWTTINGVKGYKVTSKKDSSCSIFLPTTGSIYETSLGGVGSVGCYWTSSLYTPYPNEAWCYNTFDQYNNWILGGCERYKGVTVRPVCP